MGVEFTSATPAIPNGAAPGPTRAANACAARGNLRMPETQTKNSSLPAPEKVFLFVKGALFNIVCTCVNVAVCFQRPRMSSFFCLLLPGGSTREPHRCAPFRVPFVWAQWSSCDPARQAVAATPTTRDAFRICCCRVRPPSLSHDYYPATDKLNARHAASSI